MKKSLLLAALVVAVVSVVMNPLGAVATHQPADKAQASASDIDAIAPENDLLLAETMKVSSTSDLILQMSAECSILTALNTAGGPEATQEGDGAFGQVKLYITLDGKRVPVSTDDVATDDDVGEVVFCNRAYQRTVVDREEDENPLATDNNNGDGIDGEDDFLRTRNANAFNWMAFDVGSTYDDPANGNNIIDVKVFAEYDRSTMTQSGTDDPVSGEQSCGAPRPDDDLSPYGQTCADAFVGSRSLIIEAVHASNHEQPAAVND